MVIVTQGSTKIHFSDSDAYIKAVDNYVVLFTNNQQKVLGQYETPERARETLKEIADRLRYSGVILPDE